MPRTSQASTRRRRTADLTDANPVAVLDQPDSVENGELFTPFDSSVSFWRAVAMMSEADWERCVIYLYRLDPKVRNPEGSKKYIDCLHQPIDEGYVKEQHGGGKYQAFLRDDTDKHSPLARSHVFEIDGPPKFLPGQTAPLSPGGAPGIVQAVPAAAPSQHAPTSDTAEVVREVLRAIKQQDPGSQNTIETMMKANAAAIEIVKTASVREVNSTTGNPLLDKMLDKMLENSISGKESPRDSRMDKLMDLAVARLLDPPQQEQKDPLQQLGFVKEMLGVESFADLIVLAKGGGADWKTELLKPLGGLVANLPALLAFFSQQAQLNFQRQLALIEARRNGNGRGVPSQPSNVIPIDQQTPPPGGVIGAPAVPQIDLTQLALADIVIYFNRGLDGKTSADLTRSKYPQLVEQLKPLLANEDQVKMFAQFTPPLSHIAGDEEFPEFLKEFCAEILNPEPDEADGSPTS